MHHVPGAFRRALLQLGDPGILRLLALGVVLALAAFALLWAGVAALLSSTALTDLAWLETVLDLLGGLAVLVLTWLLFPAVASATVALFLERTAAAVEARHYPDLPRATGATLPAALGSSLRFLAVTVACNVLLLPCLLLPPAYPFAYYAVNGYLLGREYFELVALRRLDPAAARALRRRHGAGAFAAGLATALFLTVPLVNLLAPVVATMAMVHLVVAWQAKAIAPR
jgi:uncharacterized protein involved in cysteine biosynthesis